MHIDELLANEKVKAAFDNVHSVGEYSLTSLFERASLKLHHQDERAFDVFIGLINSRFRIIGQLRANPTYCDCSEKEFLVEDLDKFMGSFDTDMPNKDNPLYNYCIELLEHFNQEIERSWFTNFEFGRIMLQLAMKYSNDTRDCITRLARLLPEEDLEKISNYIKKSVTSDPYGHAYTISLLPGVVYRGKKYKPEFKAFLETSSMIENNSLLAYALVSDFVRTCERLQSRGALHYYSEISEKMRPYAATMSRNLSILMMDNLVGTIDRYRKSGLENRIFEVLDFAIGVHEDPGPNTIETNLDLGFQFYQQFPEVYKEFGEESFDLVRQAHRHCGSRLQLDYIFKGIKRFREEGYDKKVDFDKWLRFVGSAGNFARYDQSMDIVKCSFKVMDTGFDLDEYREIAIDSIMYHYPLNVEHALRILQTGDDDATKRRFMDYYSLLGIANHSKLPDVKPRCSEEWLEELASGFGIEAARLIELADLLVEEKNISSEILKSMRNETFDPDNYEKWYSAVHSFNSLVHYMTNLGDMIEQKFDIFEAYALRKFFPSHAENILMYRELINCDAPLQDKIEFLRKVPRHISFVALCPPTDTDYEAWEKRLLDAKADYFRTEHNINIVCPSDVSLQVVRASRKINAYDDLIRLARMQEEARGHKRFPLGTVYAMEKVMPFVKKTEPEHAAELLIHGLLSTDDNAVREASQVFDADALLRVRHCIETSHFPPPKLYHFIKEIVKSDSPTVTARRLAVELYEVYLLASTDNPGLKALDHMTWYIQMLMRGDEVFNTICVKMQDGVIGDIAYGDRLKCCTLLGDGSRLREAEGIWYNLDPDIGLMHVLPEMDEQSGAPIAAAVVANTLQRNGDKTLLVDSFEAGRIFRTIEYEKTFPPVLKGIAGLAEDTDSMFVMFNRRVSGNLPRVFARYFQHFVNEEPSEVHLRKCTQEYPQGLKVARHLEAFQDKEKLEGTVKGYLIETSRLRELVGAR